MSQELDCLHNHQESPRTSRGAKVVGDKTLVAMEEIAMCAIVRPTMDIVRLTAFLTCGELEMEWVPNWYVTHKDGNLWYIRVK